MKKFIVHLPITGEITVEVDAETKQEALEQAWYQYNEEGFNEKSWDIFWEATDKVTEGNVTHAMLNEEWAQELKNK